MNPVSPVCGLICVHVVCAVCAQAHTHTHAQFRGLGIVIGMESAE